MIDQARKLDSEPAVSQAFGDRLAKMDEELTGLHSRSREMDGRMEDLENKVQGERQLRTADTGRLKNELKALKDTVQAQAKSITDLEQSVKTLTATLAEHKVQVPTGGNSITKMGLILLTCFVAAGGFAWYFLFRK